MSEYVPADDKVRAVWRDAMTQTSEYFDALSPAEADRRFNAWLQAHDARIASEAAEKALREAAREIDLARNQHWQGREVQAGGRSWPADYGKHDAYEHAKKITLARADSLRAEREGER